MFYVVFYQNFDAGSVSFGYLYKNVAQWRKKKKQFLYDYLTRKFIYKFIYKLILGYRINLLFELNSSVMNSWLAREFFVPQVGRKLYESL